MSLRPRALFAQTAAPQRFFGRGRSYVLAAPMPAPLSLSDDVKLFATTFAGGFLFMAVYLS